MASDRGTAPGGEGRQQEGRKILGLKPRTAVIVGVAFLVAGIGYIIYRRRQAASQQASSGTAGAAGTATAPGPCYDAAGNVVDCSDPSAVTGPNASTFQSEIQDLQGQLAAAQGAEAQNATGLQTQTSATGEQETDVAQLTAEEQRLQQDIASLERQEQTEKRRPPPRRPPPRRPPPIRRPGPVQRAHFSRRPPARPGPVTEPAPRRA